MSTPDLQLSVGIKTDPIETRYSYEWLFSLLSEEGIRHVQIGTFFELYHLPDEFFIDLRRLAESYGLSLTSVFSAHRELGGFFRFDHPAWEGVARRAWERLIEVGALLGAESVGSSAGAVMRDQPGTKDAGIRRYLGHMKELMHVAHEHGLKALTIEPMSCQAEPPTLPEEVRSMAEDLLAYHRQHPDSTTGVGYCVDVSHGYADRDGQVVWDNMQLFEATLPYLDHIHLKNTDTIFNSTFGFSEAERARGIIDVRRVREVIMAHAEVIPVRKIVGYLEIGGPKTGRDYSDWKLEGALRESLRYLSGVFC